MKVLVPNVPLRRELGTLPAGVELVDRVDPEVEVMVVAPELGDEVDALLPKLPALRLIQAFSAGVDSLLPLVPSGVVLCRAVGVHDGSVAEWVVAAILAMERRLPEFLRAQAQARWDRAIAEPEGGASSTVRDLEQMVVLVVGHGSIGRALAARLEPFGARVVGVARHSRDGAQGLEALARLLSEADVVVDLLPLTPETERFVDASFLAQMKRGALFVNAGRGRTVDTSALLEALEAHRVRAALDVTDPEPLPPDHPLWRAPNVLITPHIAGTVARWEERAYRFAGEQIRRYAAGLPLVGIVERS
ncbi:MAG TPA: 2-hydroxyacid dehydrogenase [Candidatus Dormibacteraeota bacterium]